MKIPVWFWVVVIGLVLIVIIFAISVNAKAKSEQAKNAAILAARGNTVTQNPGSTNVWDLLTSVLSKFGSNAGKEYTGSYTSGSSKQPPPGYCWNADETQLIPC